MISDVAIYRRVDSNLSTYPLVTGGGINAGLYGSAQVRLGGGDQRFESALLQRRVCRLSVPLAKTVRPCTVLYVEVAVTRTFRVTSG
jgi:hypothetical protein